MKQRGLVFIDMILDSRYGIIRQISGDIAADLLVESDAYRKRHVDIFGPLTNGAVDDEEFKRHFAERDVETLFHSRMTDFVYHLREDMKEGLLDMQRGVLVEALVIDINIWPYDLDAKSAETIRRAVVHYMPPEVVVNIVNLKPEDLTPKFLDGAYEMMAIYDHEDWLKHHIETISTTTPIRNFVILTPSIASSGVVPEPTPEIRNPFLCRSAILVHFVALHYVSVSWVCYNPAIPQLIQSQRQKAAALPDPSHPEQT